MLMTVRGRVCGLEMMRCSGEKGGIYQQCLHSQCSAS